MALITCTECGKEVSEKAIACPNCGNPINKKIENEEYLCCPKCYSKELHAEQKGFSGGKALAGWVLTGGIGILAGTIGNKEVQITCLKCGNKFKAGEALIVDGKTNNYDSPLDEELKKIIESKGMMGAVLHYKEKTNCDLADAKKYVDALKEKTGIIPAKGNSGCASVIVLFFIIAVALGSYAILDWI